MSSKKVDIEFNEEEKVNIKPRKPRKNKFSNNKKFKKFRKKSPFRKHK